MDTESPSVFNSETTEMGESPLRSQCRHAYAVARLSTLQITMGAFHSDAADIGQRLGIEMPPEGSL